MSASFCIESYPLCGLEKSPPEAGSIADVEALIARPGMKGWVQRTGSVHVVGDGTEANGVVVAADLVENPTTSHRIRRAGNLWRIWTYTEVPGGQSHRAQAVTHIGIGDVERLEYRVYWQKLDPTGFNAHGVKSWRPVVDRLVAIHSGKGAS